MHSGLQHKLMGEDKKSNSTLLIDGKTATVSFFHPKANSLTLDLCRELTATIKSLSQNDQINSIVLASHSHRAFCAGANLNEVKNCKNLDDRVAFFTGLANLLLAIIDCPVPVVGRVHGPAVGGGVGIVAACDYVFGTTNTFFQLTELDIGFGPFVIGPILANRIGNSNLSQMAIDGKKRSADWANKAGLISILVEDIEELNKEVKIFCDRTDKLNRKAITELKASLTSHLKSLQPELHERAIISAKFIKV